MPAWPVLRIIWKPRKPACANVRAAGACGTLYKTATHSSATTPTRIFYFFAPRRTKRREEKGERAT
eukprot:4324093-Alexandrium_andersonii.AAC.1